MAREEQTDSEGRNGESAMSHASTSCATLSTAQAASSLARLVITEDSSGSQASGRGQIDTEADAEARIPVTDAGMDRRAEEVEWDCGGAGEEFDDCRGVGEAGVETRGEGEEGDDWEVHDTSGYATGNSENEELDSQSEACTPRGCGEDDPIWEVSDDAGVERASGGEGVVGSQGWEVADEADTREAAHESEEEWEVEVVREEGGEGWGGAGEEEEGYGKTRGGSKQGRRRLSKFDIQCPPGGQEKIVLYVTSLQGIRKTYSDCAVIRGVLQRMSLPFDERDVAIHHEFLTELKSVLAAMPMSVPQLFIRGHHIGGADVVTRLVDADAFSELVEEIDPIRGPPHVCEGCGNVKFVPCLQCSGSHKILDSYGEKEDCPMCNENGLIRCPWCAV